MQLFLAHPNRRVRPDYVEEEVAGNILGRGKPDRAEVSIVCIVCGDLQGSVIDVHSPHARVGSLEG
jgi:hypothetical protein